jgi:glucokinase
MRLVGAVDIGGTRTKIGIVGEDGSLVTKGAVSTSERGEPEPLVDAIVSTLRPMLDAQSRAGRPVAAIGVSVAGFLDRDRTAMYANANLPALCNFPLKRTLGNRLGRDVTLEVDSNAAALAEHRLGAGRGSARLLVVTVGTGLGGGVVLNGELLRYNGECAGDIGHIIVDPNGRQCTCGARGCLEAMVSSAALSERGGGRPVREVVKSARRGEQPASDAIAETARWIGLGLASLSPLFAPDRIVVAGGVAAAGDLLLDPLRASYRLHAAPDFRHRVEIVSSSFRGWEGMIGAALGALLASS